MKNKEKEVNVWLPLALSCMMAVGMVFGYKMNAKDESPLISHIDAMDDYPAPIGQIEELIRFVETKYVDSVDREELVSEAVSAILSKLDPHSIYISPERLSRVNEEMDGSFYGIGIESFFIDDTVNIIRTVEGGPADKSGMKAFDQILEVNGVPVAGQELEFSEIEQLIKGQNGEEVKLTLKTKTGSNKNVNVRIGEIPLKSVDIAFNISDEVFYIKINRFSNTTYKEFMDHFETMHQNGTQHMIIDLRGNPGGYLPQATNILSQLFREKGKLLVYTEGRTDNKLEYKTTGKPFFNVDKISILIDEGSASGSEIIAGAIQDWDRGVVVGRRSFGKGLVQEQYKLGNGGAIRLTVARYFIPSGRSIQKSYEEIGEYDNDIYNRIHGGELYEKDSTSLSGKADYKTMILERSVSGGGGVTPDVFIPIDSVELDYQYLQLYEGVNQFVFERVRTSAIEPTEENLTSLTSEFLNGAEDDIVSQSIKNKLKFDIKEAIINYREGELAMYKYMIANDKAINSSIRYFEEEYGLEE